MGEKRNLTLGARLKETAQVTAFLESEVSRSIVTFVYAND